MKSIQDILTEANVLPKGWELEVATSINQDGTIIAGAGKYNNIETAWRAVIPRS